MKKLIAALVMSLDGRIEGPDGELDWIDSWDDPFEGLFDEVDACVLGAGMYPGYEQYWSTILADPDAVLPFSGKVASEGEVAYARWAGKTPHFVLSKSLDHAEWKSTRFLRGIDEVRQLKDQPGKSLYAVGGATLVSSLINHGLIDELRLVVRPVVLGDGKALFKDVKQRQALQLVRATTRQGGNVTLIYVPRPASATLR